MNTATRTRDEIAHELMSSGEIQAERLVARRRGDVKRDELLRETLVRRILRIQRAARSNGRSGR